MEDVIHVLGLDKKRYNLPSQLSGGQQQRVAIARALASKPAIILADEPTGNLDSATSQDVLSLLKVTSDRFGQTVVMITHNEEIAQMADRIRHESVIRTFFDQWMSAQLFILLLRNIFEYSMRITTCLTHGLPLKILCGSDSHCK